MALRSVITLLSIDQTARITNGLENISTSVFVQIQSV